MVASVRGMYLVGLHVLCLHCPSSMKHPDASQALVLERKSGALQGVCVSSQDVMHLEVLVTRSSPTHRSPMLFNTGTQWPLRHVPSQSPQSPQTSSPLSE